MNKRIVPPQLPLRFFRWYCHSDYREDIEGDLQERFKINIEEKGIKLARWRFFKDVILLFRPGIVRSINGTYKLNQYGMLKNYFKTAIRNFLKQKVYTFINMTGLTVGLVSSILILLWVQDEIQYDHFHEKDRQVYQVLKNLRYAGNKIVTSFTTQHPLAGVLENNYAEIEQATLVSPPQTELFQYEKKYFKERGHYVSPAFLEIFSFPLLAGDHHTALDDIHGVVISDNLARKYFGEDWRHENKALGQTIRIGNREDFKVTGVIETPPSNSSFQFDFLISIEDFLKQNKRLIQSWSHNMLRTYVQVQEGTDLTQLNEKIRNVVNEQRKFGDDQVFLQKFSERYLYGNYDNGKLVGGRIEYVRIFFVVAIFILIIASINFMNLATARASGRAKEIGVRKVMGAKKGSLRMQFMVESTLITLLALLLSLALVHSLLVPFNELTDKAIKIDYSNPQYWMIALGIAIFTGALAGSYPALFLSNFKIIGILKGGMKHTNNAIVFRRGLVVLQFALSIFLIITTITVFNQVNYIQNKNLGMDRNNLLYMDLEEGTKKQFEVVKEKLLQMPGIASVAASGHNPLYVHNVTSDVKWKGKREDDRIAFNIVLMHYDFLETMKMELKEGRDYSPEFAGDFSNSIINEAAARAMGIEAPIGEGLTLWGIEGQIIGVVKDFHFRSMYSPIEPLIIRLYFEYTEKLFVRAGEGQIAEAIASLEKIHKEFNPGYPFEYHFMDEQFDSMYRSEIIIGKLANYFAFLAIFISCLGLLGLVSFSVAQRTKEIGIRKVFGATVTNLVTMLSGEYAKLIVLSFVLTAPVGYYFTNNWLQDFEYRISLSPWVFLMAGVITLAIAGLTVALKSLQAAKANPIDTLRNE
ncbi:ABC transporter permease [Fulvivirgaceae bacterium BMA12]|uniref:ABC transporter permease n=1 Tax=Agaribacillus aureus TaxID=3051825 RepID=A0ABT8L1Y0_9BACT|nr:ABC transporter permease [Fulvivirgaceae bacterium BMA12]